MGKIFARAIAHRFLAKIAQCLHRPQCSFVPRKGAHHAVMSIEKSANALESLLRYFKQIVRPHRLHGYETVDTGVCR